MLANRLLILVVLIIGPQILFAQTDLDKKDSIKGYRLNQLVISGSKFSELKKNVAQKIDVISEKELKRLNAQTTADVLTQSGRVFVQKSQQGGGSPVIRGFEASRVLLMVDGIRLNNAIYRSGHLQNVITVDNNMLRGVEILNGPASTIYGSDALGGVVQMKTKEPKLGLSDSMKLTGVDALLRHATVNNEKTLSVGLSFGSKEWGSFTNLSYSSYGDLMQGKNDPSNQLDFWGRDFTVERYFGLDSMFQTDNPYEQKYSGYNQINLLQKLTYLPNLNNKHSINIQFSNTSDIPRYDRLSQTTNGIARNAEWYYGPQFRTLAAYEYSYIGDKKYYDDFLFNVSHQAIRESRNTRRYRDAWLNQREENLHVIGSNIAARKKIEDHEITIGADAQINLLQSSAEALNIVDGESVMKIDTRYPDGKNNMNLYGVYAQHVFKFGNGHFVLNDGIRFNATSLKSTILDTGLFNFPFSRLEQTNSAVTGNLGLVYFANEDVRLNLSASRGFRSPNIDDMGKIFESITGERLVVPNDQLKPEFTTAIDVGVDYRTKNVYLNAYGFYTWFDNVIVTSASTFNGQDSIPYQGVMTKVFSNQNKSKAFLYGGGFEAKAKFTKNLSAYAHIAYTYGRFTEDDGSLIPLDHVPPIFGRIGARWQDKKFGMELFTLFNGEKDLQDYNPDGEDNLNFALPSGTPSWYTVNMRASYAYNENFLFQLGLDNLLDRNYRYFASGISAGGRNLILSVRYSK